MILGIHSGPHDSSAALIQDGMILAMMEQERFDHKKHSGAFPVDAIAFCLDHARLRLEDLTAVAYANDVGITNQYKSAFIRATYPDAFRPPLHEQCDIENTLRSRLSFNGRL